MTGPPVDDASSGPPGWHLHQSGPWLVVYGSGPDSEDTAVHIRKQCITRGIGVVVHPIDEIRHVRLDRFPGLVVVLPSELADPSAGLRPFTRLIVDYRARRPEGLASIIDGSCEWFDAGVVHVVGRRVIMQHPGMWITRDRVCARHYTDETGLPDLFQPYTQPYTRNLVIAQQPDEQLAAGEVRDENIGRIWRDVQAWGVTDIQDVPRLRKCIDDYRDQYESMRFSQLYRPISDINRNRLDIILDGPDDSVVGSRKTWMENGARVCRNVMKELKKIVPELARPGRRDNTKDAQKQLRRLYRNLRIIESYLRHLNH
jgi:hypothetical protein